jgi:hypothetical protein
VPSRERKEQQGILPHLRLAAVRLVLAQFLHPVFQCMVPSHERCQ